jgi:hypothetical protein
LRIKGPSLAPYLPTDTLQSDLGLALVIEQRGILPDAIRAGMLTMVRAATSGG